MIPNDEEDSGIYVDIGQHQNDCLGNIMLCTKGLTLSLWFQGQKQKAKYPVLFISSSIKVHFKQGKNDLDLYITLTNTTHQKAYTSGLPVVTFDEWHLIAITYSTNKDFEVYYDGHKLDNALPTFITTATLSPVNVQFGCSSALDCGKFHYDDFRFWNVRKSPRFMWYLWKM